MQTVLVVDDENQVRDVVCRYLEREGFRTLEASEGETARELILREQPDLVVLDLMLPGVDGLELCRLIRERSSMPVIMLTARGDEADRIVGLELGADDYVVKPFSPRELVARVKTVLRRSGPVGGASELLSSTTSRSISPRARCGSAASRCISPRRSSTCSRSWRATPAACSRATS